MHDWKKGDLGVATDVVSAKPTFTPGTVVRYEERSSYSTTGYWRVIFGPRPPKDVWYNHDTDTWVEDIRCIDPLPNRDNYGDKE